MFSKLFKTKTDIVNEKIHRIKKATEVKDIRCLANFNEILNKNPYRENIQGYYVEIPLSEYKTFVPISSQFPDRYGNNYEGGQFDAPLFTLKEWRDNWKKGHPNTEIPDLLINANWFNVWTSGIPNVGEKINPRTQPRTYLIGLSLSNGELVSTHKVLDQNNIGLDTITFDTADKKAAIIPHDSIDAELEKNLNFYDNKNAVSGFIILKDQSKLKTPDLNNNHSNRLPRTGVGYKNNGNTIVIIVIHNPDRNFGVTAEEFADLFEELDCTDAINLDNSGSVELYYEGLGEFGKKLVTAQTKTCDAGTTTERPKPNCLGFKNVSKCTFFAKDDSDLPTHKSSIVEESLIKTDDDITTHTY
ncbi:phosphodiester glycosidase family protein [Legionella norrlandica]|uniref:phosphodiester glycosidase family protein n=1 Tax=Legionella norrlandica TaxID=1498499 RepID=UPI000567919C|nr:phosphodiester glycosidase family protein [Legionella norrlandica]